MLGLTYVRHIYNLTMEELANKLGVSKQTVSKWESLKIVLSPNRIDQLSEIFNLPQEIFQKELDELDKIKIQKIKIDNAIISTATSYSYETTNPETNERIEVTDTIYDFSQVIELKHTSYIIDKMELLKKVENSIEKNIKTLEKEEYEFAKGIDVAEELIQYYNAFTELINNVTIDKSVIRDFLKAMDVHYNKISIGFGTDITPFLIDVLNALRKQGSQLQNNNNK